MTSGSKALVPVADSPTHLIGPRWTTIAALQGNDRRPRVVRLSITPEALPGTLGAGSEFLERLQIGGSCGIWWNQAPNGDHEPWEGGAALRLRYGSREGVMRTIYADLREGEYNIPPCGFAEVAAARWGSIGPATQWHVGAEIVEGVTYESTPLVLTASRSGFQNAPAWLAVPPGAYALEAFGGYIGGLGGGGVSIVAGTAVAARRILGGEWSPPSTPLTLDGSPYVALERIGGDPIPGESSDDWAATVQFYVR